MRFPLRRAVVAGVMFFLAAAYLPAQTVTKTSTSKTTSSKTKSSASSNTSKTLASAKSNGHRRTRKTSWKRHGQQGIQPERARAIQEALIREHYLTGEPSGVWDTRSKEAMTRFQADNGWQSKVTPDSRALIKLGLGPTYSEKDLYKSSSAAPPAAPATSANR